MPLILPSIWIYIRQDKWNPLLFPLYELSYRLRTQRCCLVWRCHTKQQGLWPKALPREVLILSWLSLFLCSACKLHLQKKFRPAFPYIFTSKTIPASKNKTTTAEITQSFFLSFVFDKSSPNIDKFLFLLIDSIGDFCEN